MNGDYKFFNKIVRLLDSEYPNNPVYITFMVDTKVPYQITVLGIPYWIVYEYLKDSSFFKKISLINGVQCNKIPALYESRKRRLSYGGV